MQKITESVRTTLRNEPRAHYDETHLLLCVFESHGLLLTPEQQRIIADLPNPKSVLRIAEREKKRLLLATRQP